jgi:hypothetical protein
MNNMSAIYFLLLLILTGSCSKAQDGIEEEQEKSITPDHIRLNYALAWSDEYVFYVNGIETWRTSTAVSQRSQYIILSTELTGWGGDPATGMFPDTVKFDYVRVYKPK